MDRLEIFLYAVLVVVVVLSIVNLSVIYSASQKFKPAEKEAPANLQLVKIMDSSCSQCFDIDSIVASLKKANVNITSEKNLDIASEEAKKLISQYGIQKIPTVIVTGEVNKSSRLWNNNWKTETKNGEIMSAFYLSVGAPYLNVSSGKVVGMVSLTYITDSSCSKCSSLLQVISYLKQQAGVKVLSEKTLEYNSSEAQELIARHGIDKIPVFVVSKDVLEYPAVVEIWTQLNATEKDGFYTVPPLSPPYRDTKTNTIQGLVAVIYLKDPSCSSCYDVMKNKQILESSLGIALGNETVLDTNSSSGQSMLKKYNITAAPMILLSPDAALYKGFDDIWSSVGDIANDSWYVMRKPGVLGVYKDILKNQTVNQITLYAADSQYQPGIISVKSGELLRIAVLNAGQSPHSFAVDEFGIRSGVIGPRESETVEFTANKTGTFSFYSYYQDDRQKGLIGSLIIE